MGKALKNLALISQLAINMIVPILGAVLLANWLMKRYSVGNWIIVIAVILGVTTGAMSVWKLLRNSVREAERNAREYRDNFRQE